MLIPFQRRAFAAALSLSSMMILPSGAAGQESAPPSPPIEAPLDPASPMAELPDIGVEWPDMGDSLGSSTPSATPQAVEADDTADRRYSVSLEGLEKLNAAPVRARFDALSTLKQGENKPANSALMPQLNPSRQAHCASGLRSFQDRFTVLKA
jgi:translocation and assembly module TamA